MSNTLQRAAAADLMALLEHVLVHHCGCIAKVSKKTCEEIIEHHERDLKRLKVLHPDGVHPAKHIAYLVFWVRKLKPVSNAYRTGDVIGQTEIEDDLEFVTINEILAIYVAQHLILSYTIDGYMSPGLKVVDRAALRQRIEEILKQVLTSPLGSEKGAANVFAAFVYDMRYRTFGPHHIVHFINHVLYAAHTRLEQKAA